MNCLAPEITSTRIHHNLKGRHLNLLGENEKIIMKMGNTVLHDDVKPHLQPEPVNLEYYLRSLKDEVVYYRPNPGNAGDFFIACATISLFKKCNITFKIITDNDDLKNQVVVYGGGGNLIELYSDAKSFIENHHHRAKKFILLPHTISANHDLLASLGSNVDLFSREMTTFNHTKSVANKANVFLSHDIVFSFDASHFLHSYPSGCRFLSYSAHELRKSWHISRKRKKILGTRGPAGKVLNVFRLDNEKTKISIPEGNIDLPRVLTRGTFTENIINDITYYLLNIINDFEKINTNRLHVCIAGALLGKRVDFYANSYFKNRSIYQFSIEGKYPHVKWQDNNS